MEKIIERLEALPKLFEETFKDIIEKDIKEVDYCGNRRNE